MKFQVVVSQKAESDLRHYYSVAAEHAPDTAVRWLNRFEAALGTLDSNLPVQNQSGESPRILQAFFCMECLLRCDSRLFRLVTRRIE